MDARAPAQKSRTPRRTCAPVVHRHLGSGRVQCGACAAVAAHVAPHGAMRRARAIQCARIERSAIGHGRLIRGEQAANSRRRAAAARAGSGRADTEDVWST